MGFEPKTDLGEKSLDSKNNILGQVEKNIIYLGEVRSTNDPLDSGRIKIRIRGLDDKLKDADLPYCTPLLPKYINVIPQVGEVANIFVLRVDKTNIFRQYIGPIISQPQRLEKDPYYFTALSNTELAQAKPLAGVSSIPDAEGVYPTKDEVAFQGRKNADLVFKDSELVLRAGKFEFNNNTKRNLTNPAYIQLKYDSVSGTTSVANIVANKINLIAHGGNPIYPAVLSDQDILDIAKTAFSSLRGEKVLEFFKLMQDFVANHIHPYSNLSPNPGVGKIKEIINFDLNTMLSTNIKIN